MLKERFSFMVMAAGVVALALGSTTELSFAQAKKSGATDKRSACIAKARAENPSRTDGNARNAAFNRCMRGG